MKINMKNVAYIWDKIFKNGLGEICGRQPLTNMKCISNFNFFKGCLPQIHLVHS